MSVCNIYKSQGNKPVFYTFSEYMNDLVVNINNDGMSIARPSRFLCLKLKSTENINVFLQNYYEDACCTLRDTIVDTNVENYRKYLLGGLIHGLKEKRFIDETAINNIVCEDINRKKIDIFDISLNKIDFVIEQETEYAKVVFIKNFRIVWGYWGM